MTTHTTIKSPGALVLGVFFTAITLRTIFDDVWNGATFTIAHMNAIGALVAAIAAGHLVWPMLKQFRVPAAIGLSIIFAASTYYIATSAASRNAEADAQKTARIVKTNAERAGLRTKVTQAEADVEDARGSHTAAKRDAAKECGTGKASKCDGKTATRDYAAADLEKAESHASMMRGKLSLLGPDEQVHEGYKRAGEVFASAGYGNAAEIAAKLAVQMPFLAVLINEVATLVFLGMGIAHGNPPTISNLEKVASPEQTFAATKTEALANVEPSPLVLMFSGDQPDPTPPRGGRKSNRKTSSANVVPFPAKHPVVQALEKNGGSVASNHQLATLMGVSDGEASKRWPEIEHALDVVKRGKSLHISLKPANVKAAG